MTRKQQFHVGICVNDFRRQDHYSLPNFAKPYKHCQGCALCTSTLFGPHLPHQAEWLNIFDSHSLTTHVLAFRVFRLV